MTPKQIYLRMLIEQFDMILFFIGTIGTLMVLIGIIGMIYCWLELKYFEKRFLFLTIPGTLLNIFVFFAPGSDNILKILGWH